ncbi:MAG: asparaginase [Alloprevotella sp.]
MEHHTHTPHILIIYTGGTIGMIENPETGALENFDFEQFRHHVPELKRFNFQIDALAFESPIDSSDMEPRYWIKMARIIAEHYDNYDGFVLLHGTDTMAFTASALSFMLENLTKPVIVTGSQLPIGQLRTDGKENLLTSIEIAAARNAEGKPMVPEVCIFFESKLMRGNRTTKINAEGFNAFRSFNFAPLAYAGIHIKYDEHLIHQPKHDKPFKPHFLLDNNVLILTLFPGIRKEVIDTCFAVNGLRAVILKTYGSGNAPQKPWFLERIRQLIARDVIVVNISQCYKGTVEMHRYETGLQLLQAGVINGYDSTVEAVITKLMFLLGHSRSTKEIIEKMNTSIAGEITI